MQYLSGWEDLEAKSRIFLTVYPERRLPDDVVKIM